MSEEIKLELTPTPVEPDIPVPAEPVIPDWFASASAKNKPAAPAVSAEDVIASLDAAAASAGAAFAAPAPTYPGARVYAPTGVVDAAPATAPAAAPVQAYAAYQPAPGVAPAQSVNAQMPVGTYPSAPQPQYYMYPEATYPMTQDDRTLRQIAFILNIITTVSVGLAIIPLAWMIPMTVVSYRLFKGTRKNTTAFAVCTLIFLNVISGILLLISHREG